MNAQPGHFFAGVAVGEPGQEQPPDQEGHELQQDLGIKQLADAFGPVRILRSDCAGSRGTR